MKKCILLIGCLLISGCSIGKLVGEPCDPPFKRVPVLSGKDTVSYKVICPN